MGVWEKMHSGELYDPMDSAFEEEHSRFMELLWQYNHTLPGEQMKRDELLRRMCAQVGEGCFIEVPFRANWGGKYLRLGDKVYANYNLTLVDDTWITIGSYTMIGPNVTIATACHPTEPELRRRNLQYNRPVTIGENVWIGAGAILLPGVTIGDDSVIGAGSVVTKDIPAGVVAVGNPCKVLRKLSGEI